jgi:gamma-glutamyltranspeptidase/glutathione hydrolase
MPETPTFSSAAVASPHELAAETGQIVLAQGGNAVEAMVAMAATIAVVYPHLNAIGGDGYWLVREPGGRLHGIESCGAAASLATIGRYRERGYDTVPRAGPDAALTVAGAVAGWRLALDLAKAVGGALPLDILLADAIRFAREGYAVSISEAASATADDAILAPSPGFADAFLDQGKRPSAGAQRRQPALADTLDQLSHAGLDDFYLGDVGREIAADLERIGSPVTRRDLANHRARVVVPLALAIDGGRLIGAPQPTEGGVALAALGIFAGLAGIRAETPAHQHGLIEAFKRAAAMRDAILADPVVALAPARLAREAAAIDARRADSAVRGRPVAGEGVWMGAIDASGLAVSYWQGLGSRFGSGCVLPVTGVLWQGAGSGFSLETGARHSLEPGGKPPVAANPALSEFEDGRILCHGCAGGEASGQIAAQVLARHVIFKAEPADAVAAPRWRLVGGPGQEAGLQVEESFDPAVMRALAQLGDAVEKIEQPRADTGFGHAGFVVKQRRDGRVAAAHDSRSDGGARGL